jgi:hypothetical protein
MSRLITLSESRLPLSLRRLVNQAARVRDVVVNEDISMAFYMDAELKFRHTMLDEATRHEVRAVLFDEEVSAVGAH